MLIWILRGEARILREYYSVMFHICFKQKELFRMVDVQATAWFGPS